MMPDKNLRCWIIGAGFSYPLGAPLFHQLFSPGYRSLARAAIESHGSNTEISRSKQRLAYVDAAMELYAEGLADRSNSDKRSLWSNPEQFLQMANEYLEYADADHPIRQWIIRECATHIPAPFTGEHLQLTEDAVARKVMEAAQIELAVEVSLFLHGNSLQGEAWRPYREWLNSLSGRDVIVSFNYDQALESLCNARGIYRSVVVADSNMSRLLRDRTPLFKLHGSTGWTISESGQVLETDSPLGFLDRFDSVVGLSPPGPGKMRLADNDWRWGAAMKWIRDSSEINIIGYRFPETDMIAQQSILGAIADGSSTRINIVLGPNINAPDVRRVEAILQGVCKGQVAPRAMYAQDYLTRFKLMQEVESRAAMERNEPGSR